MWLSVLYNNERFIFPGYERQQTNLPQWYVDWTKNEATYQSKNNIVCLGQR